MSDKQAHQAKNLEKQHLMEMIKSGKRIELLPYYAHAAMVLMGLRTDAPPIPDPPYAPRYDPSAAQALLEAENASDNSDKLLQGVSGIADRFEDFRLTRERSQELIDQHNSTIEEHQQTLARLRGEELKARTKLVCHTEQRSMNVEYGDKTAALERAKVREHAARTRMKQRREILASMSESLISMAADVGRAVSMDEDPSIMLLASKLHHASLMARPRIGAHGGLHPILELVDSFDKEEFGRLNKERSLQHIKVRDMTPHASFRGRLRVADLGEMAVCAFVSSLRA